MTTAEGQRLKEILEYRYFFRECILHDIRLYRFGYGIDLVFNDVRDPEGQIRPDILEHPRLVTLRLLGVDSLTFIGGLTAAMKERPDMIDWGLAEVAIVRSFDVEDGLGVSVMWEGERRLDITFSDFESFIR